MSRSTQCPRWLLHKHSHIHSANNDMVIAGGVRVQLLSRWLQVILRLDNVSSILNVLSMPQRSFRRSERAAGLVR